MQASLPYRLLHTRVGVSFAFAFPLLQLAFQLPLYMALAVGAVVVAAGGSCVLVHQHTEHGAVCCRFDTLLRVKPDTVVRWWEVAYDNMLRLPQAHTHLLRQKL